MSQSDCSRKAEGLFASLPYMASFHCAPRSSREADDKLISTFLWSGMNMPPNINFEEILCFAFKDKVPKVKQTVLKIQSKATLLKMRLFSLEDWNANVSS